MPVGGPGEVRTLGRCADGFVQPTWSPDGKLIAFISRTRDKRYDAKDESWQPPRKIETFFTQLNGEGWIVDRPNHVYVIAADGTGTPRNLTPGPVPPRRRSPGSPTPAPSSPARRATRAGTSTSPSTSTSCRSTARSVPSRAQTGQYCTAVGVARRHARGAARHRRPDARTAELVRRDHRHRRRRDHVDLLGDRPQLAALRQRPSAGLDRRQHAARHRRGPRRDAPLRVGRRRVAGAAGAHQGPARRCRASTPPAGRWRWPRPPCNAPPSWSRSTAR